MTDDKATVWYRQTPDMSSLPHRPVPRPHTLIGSDEVPLRVYLRQSAWHDLQVLFDDVAPAALVDEQPAPKEPSDSKYDLDLEPVSEEPSMDKDEADPHLADPDDGALSESPVSDEAVTSDIPQRAGILLGNMFKDDEGPYLVIEAALPAPYTRSTSGGLIFTERTWAALRPLCEGRYPEQTVVGSFRIRHDQGTQMSDYDRYVTRRFFPDWWQVTHIVDPARQRQALFYWQHGQLHSLPGFWVCIEQRSTETDGAKAPAKVPPPTDVAAQNKAAIKKPVEALPRRWSAVALAAVAVVLLAFATIATLPGSLPALQRKLKETARIGEQLTAEAVALQLRHEQLQQVLQVVEQTGDPSSGTTPPPTNAAAGAAGRHRASLSSGRAQADDGEHYVVRPGDTLWGISTRLLGDPFAYTDLATENRIVDPDLILPGWELHLRRE